MSTCKSALGRVAELGQINAELEQLCSASWLTRSNLSELTAVWRDTDARPLHFSFWKLVVWFLLQSSRLYFWLIHMNSLILF